MRVDVTMTATPDGPLATYRAPDFADAGKPAVLMVHGALGAAGALFPAFVLFAQDFEPILCELPGHGRSPPTAEVGLDVFARQLAAVAGGLGGRRLVLAGESLGGLAVLAASARLAAAGAPPAAVVAVDPPLSTAKQWHVGLAFRQVTAAQPDNAFVRELGRRLFGVRPDDALMDERLYYPLLGAAGAPVLLLTGDVPLGGPRPMNAVACCLDAVDEYVVAETAPAVAWRRLSGVGHVALRDRPAACLAEVRAFLSDVAAGRFSAPARPQTRRFEETSC